MPIPRGPYAMTPTSERVRLRWMLVGRIAADPEFAADLAALFAEHVSHLGSLPHWIVVTDAEAYPGAEPAAYVTAVRALAERWGLDRLIEPHEELGPRLIHDWCRSQQATDREIPAAQLTRWLYGGEFVAEIGEVVGRSVTDFGDFRAIDEQVRPIVRIRFEDEWDPLREPRSSARKRLLAAAKGKIQEELDRLTEDARSKGYKFVDRAPRSARDLDWLAELMTGRSTVDELIERESADDPSLKADVRVARAVRRMAKRAGVSVRGWGLTWR